MLVLSRTKDEVIVIGDDITVRIVDVRGDRVRIGITAPPEVSIVRSELCTDEMPGVHVNGDVPLSFCI